MKKSFDQIIEEALKDVQEFPKYTITEIAEITDEKWVSSRWHVEVLESRGVVEHFERGREKLRKLKEENND